MRGKRLIGLVTLFFVVSGASASSSAYESDMISATKAAKEGRDVRVVELLEPWAEKGKPFAQYHLGIRLISGKGVPEDPEKGLRLIRHAANAGLGDAQMELGYFYLRGEHVQKDLESAIGWLKKAANNNHPFAMTTIGIAYFQGEGVKKNKEAALKWFKKAAKAGSIDAHRYLVAWYIKHDQTPEGMKNAAKSLVSATLEGEKWAIKKIKSDLRKENRLGLESARLLGEKYGAMYHREGNEKYRKLALEWLRKSANSGYAPAQTSLGDFFSQRFSHGEKDREEARAWYKKAAAAGDSMAKRQLAYKGFVSEDEAISLLKEAAEAGNNHAQMDLGVEYLSGWTIGPDVNKSKHWLCQSQVEQKDVLDYLRRAKAIEILEKHAGDGDLSALYGLATHYLDGRVPKNTKRGVKLLRLAAEEGEPNAQYLLGAKLANGSDGLEEDAGEAVHWYRKAAKQGHIHAQNQLGLHYQDGRGVSRDSYESRKWFRRAAERGHPVAELELDQEREISDAERRQAIVRASNMSDFDRDVARHYRRHIDYVKEQSRDRLCDNGKSGTVTN